MKNPFKPSAGSPPPNLLDRQDSLEMFEEGIEDGSGSPGLITLILGSRGVGKTVLLRE